MKRTFKILLTAAACAAAFQAACAADIQPLNGIAAEVNGNIITYGDIERTANVIRQNAGGQVAAAQLFQAARQSLLERTLLTDAARTQGLKAEAAEVDTEIARRAKVGNASVEEVYAHAARSGWSKKQYRLEVAKDLLIERMMASLEDGIRIDDNRIDNHIRQAREQGQSLPQGSPYTVYSVQRILLGINKNNTAASVGERMRLIAQAVEQGNDFGALARRYSQDLAAAAGGAQEMTDYSQPEKIEAFLQRLQPGQISIPVQTANDWQMIRMTGKRTESDPVKMQREAVRRLLLQQERQKARQQFIGQLQSNAVVREY